MATIHTYGDSITYGIGDPEAGGYVARLRNTMMERAMDPAQEARAVRVHNFARFGRTITGIVTSLQNDLDGRDGRGRVVVTAMVGFSDSAIAEGATEPYVPLQTFRSQLQTFTALCSIAADPVLRVFIESPPVDLSRPHPQNPGDIDPQRIAQYQEAVREHADSTGATFIETHKTLRNISQDPLYHDGIHLSAAGHIAVHGLLLDQIDTLLT